MRLVTRRRHCVIATDGVSEKDGKEDWSGWGQDWEQRANETRAQVSVWCVLLLVAGCRDDAGC